MNKVMLMVLPMIPVVMSDESNWWNWFLLYWF